MKNKFFIKNLAFFLLPLLIPIFMLGSLSIVITQSFIKEDINKNNIRMLNQVNENIELMINELDPISLSFDVNPEVTTAIRSLMGNPSLSLLDIHTLKMVKNYLSAPANSRPFIHSIYVYYADKYPMFLTSTEGLSDLKSFFDTSWYSSYNKNPDNRSTWSEYREIYRNSFDKTPIKVLTIYKKLNSYKGVIVLNIKQDYITGFLNSLSTIPGQIIFVANESNEMLFKSDSPPYLKNIEEAVLNNNGADFSSIKLLNNSYILIQFYSERYGWKYFSIIPQGALYRVPNQLVHLTSLFLFFSFVLGMSLTYYLTKKNYRHIGDIISVIDSAERGNPLPPMPSRVNDEYGYILQNILKTFIEQSYLKVQLSERKYKQQALELLALQSQINPHFLFNTLKTIYWKSFALTKNRNDVSDMIENLSYILDYSLDSYEKAVSLEEEIKVTKSYIEIQKIRYRDKFDVVWNFKETDIEYPVIKLLLQPLIENSIYHGIKEKKKASLIKIKIVFTGYALKISVIDNGLGIPYERLKEIRKELARGDALTEHIGLFNTNKRLKLTYGEQYGIQLRSKSGYGTGVYILIPINKNT